MKILLHPRLISFLTCIAALLLLFNLRCAHPVIPTGGPKDETPPVVTEADPPNYSVNFQDKKIVIKFDEFIQLKDQSKEVFTSPPMVKKPELVVRGKSLIVELNEELRDSMTYVINFGSAIVDIRESNPLKGFTYVFSTGAVIDSLVLGGKILHAFDLKPAENILFTVYSPEQDTIDPDSLFLSVPPLSATRTSSDGSFQLTNLPGGHFLVYGLEDLNNNFYYDLPTEQIAFLDSLVIPEYLETIKDTTDTVNGETLRAPPVGKIKNPLALFLFQEFDSTQRILSTSISSTGSMQFIFRLPAEDFKIMPLNFQAEEDWMIREFNRARDTLNIWPRDMERDTFQLRLSLADTIVDTVTLIKRTESQGRSAGRRGLARQVLKVNFNTSAGYLPPGKRLMMTLEEPLLFYDFSGISLQTEQDTLLPGVMLVDSIGRKFAFMNDWEEGQAYRLIIPDSIMGGISGFFNDSLKVQVRVKPAEDYGSMVMKYRLSGEGHPCIAELLNDKEAIIQRDTLTSDTSVVYTNLKPGTYRLKAFIDENANGKWDTGNLYRNILPERVLYYEKEITVRANWELQEEWPLGD